MISLATEASASSGLSHLVSIQVLGVPKIVRQDGPVALRGRKVWGLLAYLASHTGPASRQHLANLLFQDAADPLAALRWNLSELRRALGHDSLRGEHIELDRGCIAFLDVDVLRRGHALEAARLAGIGRELLEGMPFDGSPAFEVWLQCERRRMHATAQAVLHEAALARLTAGAPAEAVQLASQLLGMDSLDESSHVLLVRCLALAGDGIGAARQVAACRDLFKRELGVLPGPALSDALRTATATPIARPSSGRAGAIAQIEAGEAAIAAGALESGLECLRRAIVDADEVGDTRLRARARIALGGALVHAARGRDAEGAAALHEVLAIGGPAELSEVAAACRELGYVELLQGRYERALSWVERALSMGSGNKAEQARATILRGVALSDMAQYDEALHQFEQAQRWAHEAGDAKQSTYADSMTGRVLVLTGRMEEAAQVLDRCIGNARRMWTALLPWPLSFRAEVELRRGQLAGASEGFELAFALGCQLGDPCWEGVAGRGRGLVAAAQGRMADAMEILEDALSRCRRLPDGYLWVEAYVLDALCEVAIAHRDLRSPAWTKSLLELTVRTGIRGMVVRAHQHRHRLGEAGAAEACAVLAQEIGEFMQFSRSP